MNTRSRILPLAVIADDHPGVLDKVSKILNNEVQIVAKVGDGAAAVRATTEHSPNLLVLDIVMPQLDGIGVAREIRHRCLACRIIFLSIQEDPGYIHIAQELGASYVLKRKMNTDLVRALKEELEGKHFYSDL